jgi:hypothetical protein
VCVCYMLYIPRETQVLVQGFGLLKHAHFICSTCETFHVERVPFKELPALNMCVIPILVTWDNPPGEEVGNP